MTYVTRCSLLLLASAFLWNGIATAQAPPAGGPPRGPAAAPTNIKALPKDISRADLIKIMRQYTGDLGVECAYCHAQDPATKRTDFASDANPMKEKARFMIEMTDDLNNKYLTQMPNRMYADPITCGTCHQGQSHPAVFVPKAQPPRPPAAPPAN
jgi:Photosynthetic reaction centre cytochrome C subunit